MNVGTRVRIVKLSDSFLASLPADEIEEVRSMIDEVFEVTEIDEHGASWVGKGWSNPDEGEYHGHLVALDAAEMEIAE